uniref:Putative salivary secreted peptide n=1 Tax=Glossina morsitans morsitans TaxID=37546 RepID=D3TLU8_GLOMM
MGGGPGFWPQFLGGGPGVFFFLFLGPCLGFCRGPPPGFGNLLFVEIFFKGKRLGRGN